MHPFRRRKPIHFHAIRIRHSDPPTHEQSTPSFHVERSLAVPFLAFLQRKGFRAWEPPEIVDKRGPDQRRVIEIEMEAETPLDVLEGLIQEFKTDRPPDT